MASRLTRHISSTPPYNCGHDTWSLYISEVSCSSSNFTEILKTTLDLRYFENNVSSQILTPTFGI